MEAFRGLFECLWRHLALKRLLFSDFEQIFGRPGGAFWARKSLKIRFKMGITISIAFEVDFGTIFD